MAMAAVFSSQVAESDESETVTQPRRSASAERLQAKKEGEGEEEGEDESQSLCSVGLHTGVDVHVGTVRASPF